MRKGFKYLLAVLVGAAVAAVALLVSSGLGLWDLFGVSTITSDSQIIAAVERTEEVSLLSLAVQGIKEESNQSSVFGVDVPGASESVFLQYNFTAKLGLDGAQVDITRDGETGYVVALPEFIFIGYEEPTFKVAAQDGGLLQFATKDVDEVELINSILSSDARETYVGQHQEILRDQAQAYYSSLINAIQPGSEVVFEFADAEAPAPE